MLLICGSFGALCKIGCLAMKPFTPERSRREWHQHRVRWTIKYVLVQLLQLIELATLAEELVDIIHTRCVATVYRETPRSGQAPA